MSYTTKWTDIYRVERFLQIEINDTTHPSDAEVTDWIQEVETSMLRQGVGTQTAVSGTVMTVLPTHAVSRGSITWFLQGLPESQHGRIVVPPYIPVVSVTSGAFHKNKASLSDTPDWELLKSKDNLPDADDTDFLVVQEFNYKTGNYDGVALYFYHDIPEAGQRRLSGGWVYGYNLNSNILREYATLQVCKKVLASRLMASEPVGMASYRGPDLQEYVNTNTDSIMNYINARIEELEEKHFPEDLPIAIIQGT